MRTNYSCVLTIAGTDPSGGAGIQADIKAISATGGYAASAITALVAQNTLGVQDIQEVPPKFIQHQIDVVCQDLDINTIKIGMLHNHAVIEVVATSLEKYQPKNVILDPVMVAKNGCLLLDLDTIDFLKERLLPLVSLITPNLHEAEKLLGTTINTTNQMQEAAETLANTHKINVLLKGGHLNSDKASDILYQLETNDVRWYHSNRINTQNTHGTGCTLSAAIASFIAQGYELANAVFYAKKYIERAIISGSSMKIGKGHGPVDHFYFLENASDIIFST